MKMWERDYVLNKQIEAFTVGNDYIIDQHLVKYDCIASIAHARMLGKIGILTGHEVEKLVSALQEIVELDHQGEFTISREQEDCHTAIEEYLTDRLGEVGEKIHTGRSRNDQVLTALRLFSKEMLTDCKIRSTEVKKSIMEFVEKAGKVPLPGYSHGRKAMPSSISLWGQAFVDSMTDNETLLDTVYDLVDQSPLGTGAGYGIPLEVDRQYTADALGFDRVQQNPIYTQFSRGKFETTILHVLSQIMFDVNKIATDLIIFSMPEFGFFELPREFCTGSSIMPHKKNPDVLELLRAKYHKVVACEFQMKSIVGNLMTGYNRDVQLTKEPTIKGFQITNDSLAVLSLIFEHLQVNRENCENAMTDDVFATEEVYKLVQEGVPFREAYRKIARRYH